MADETAVMEEGTNQAESPLVAVSFQKNLQRAQKYLEAEPKALGVTQIGLSMFHITCVGVFLAKGLSHLSIDIPFFIASPLVVLAGCVAVAAQNLDRPTLRACLGMQIVACVASLVNMIVCMGKMSQDAYICWNYYYENTTHHNGDICQKLEDIHSHFYAESIVIQATLFAISATLAAYSCKVVNCCTTGPKMTVITVQAPAVQQ